MKFRTAFLLIGLFLLVSTSFAFEGHIVGSDGLPLATARIQVTAGSASSVVIADSTGHFVIEPDPAVVPFKLQAILPNGTATQSISINAIPGSASLMLKVNSGMSLSVSQSETSESTQRVPNTEIVVTAPRMDVPLKETPAATTVVTEETLKTMPRGIAADEALKLVPGVKVDNQADGERVHLSIRGQGLLTERGVRGIKVVLDGLPLNDPTGFAPDLFDVDWSTVQKIEVLRGPSSAIYGGGSAGGIINISTRDGQAAPLQINGGVTFGSYGFWKASSEINGTSSGLNYRVSASRTFGDGYRDHTAFHATNVYGKFRANPSPSVRLTGIVAGTSFFNENAEGLNLVWLAQDRRQANPDALTYNEYQKTQRGSFGLTGQVDINENQKLSWSLYYRHTEWRESVPSSIQHRTFDTPGSIFQYSIQQTFEKVKNIINVGADFDWQQIDEYRRPNMGGAVEGPTVISDQMINQRGIGIWAMDRVEFNPQWSIVLDMRSDHIRNELADRLRAGGLNLSGDANFSKATGRLGLSWNPSELVGLYASWGQGFLPSATEELANNPDHIGGFNTHLVPATSYGEEIGARGTLYNQFVYEAAFFHLRTENDFGRYRIATRPLETFYQNAGTSRRYGIETAIGWYPLEPLAIKVAYTYSDFKYLDIKTITGEEYRNTYIPNSPKHQIYLDAEYSFEHGFAVGIAGEGDSHWYIDPSNVTWSNGYFLVHPRISYRWKGDKYKGDAMVSIRNLFGKEYIAFTEPDPDGNSYQPAPTREIFVGAQIGFGE